MERKARFALIGCGRISINHLDAIAHAPHAELIAVCDILEDVAKEVAEKEGCKYYTDIEDMLNNEQLDVCCILTPSGMHAEHVCLVAKHGVNVFCEKPIDISKENIDLMINTCHEMGVKLGCVFQRRTFDAAIKTREAVQKGYFGKITIADAYLKYLRDDEYYASADWRGTWKYDGGGALMNQGIHGIDMISWIMGGVESVNADCETLAREIEVEDTAVIRVKYKNGAIGVIEGATTAYPGLDTVFSIHGTKGSVVFGDKGFYIWDFEDKSITEPEVHNSMGGINCQYNETNFGHTYLLEDMALAVLEDRSPMISGEEAREAVDIILAIYESSKNDKTVNV